MPDTVDLATRRRSEILGAALKIVSEKGYQNTGIADIAAEPGIRHGTFYRYVKNGVEKGFLKDRRRPGRIPWLRSSEKKPDRYGPKPSSA